MQIYSIRSCSAFPQKMCWPACKFANSGRYSIYTNYHTCLDAYSMWYYNAIPCYILWYEPTCITIPYIYIIYIYIYIYNYYTSMLLKEYIYFSSRWYFQMNIFGRCSSSSSLIWHCSLIVKMNIHLVSGLTQMNGKIIVLLCDKGYINN